MINKINKLSQSEFIKVFADIFENARWIAKELHNQKPFNNFEGLRSKMLAIFENASKEKQLKIALSNSFGFGGTNASLIFSEFY